MDHRSDAGTDPVPMLRGVGAREPNVGDATSVRKRRTVEDALAHYSLDGDNIDAAMGALREVLDTDRVVLYSLTQRPGTDDLMISRDAVIGYDRDQWRRVMDDFLRGRGGSFGSYNAIHPEPAQRDRVLSVAELLAITDGRSAVVDEVLHRRLGSYGSDTMRALVCEGPSLLAWVGLIQPGRTTQRQRTLLTQLLPAFRRRLAFERRISESALAAGAVAAALEAVNAPVWLIGPNGRIAHANAAGLAEYDRDPAVTLAALTASVTAAVPDPRFKVTALRDSIGSGAGGKAGHLVVGVVPSAAAVNGVSAAANRFGLTPAQTRVLERVARGASNAKIAAELGVAERTVEAHVTAILVKAQVPSRAALIVEIFREHRTT